VRVKKERRERLEFEVKKQRKNLAGVAPASVREILEREASRPMRGNARELGESSLFGEGFKQQSMF
jgi:hypothetical protein